MKQEESTELEDLEEEHEDNFDKIYKGEVSKSGTAILPSKRVRRIPEMSNKKPSIEETIKDDKNKSENLQEQFNDQESSAEKNFRIVKNI